MSRSQFNYESQKKENPKLLSAIYEIKAERPCYGVRRVHNSLVRRNFVINEKKVRRLLRSMRLLFPAKVRRKKLCLPPSKSAPTAFGVGDVWAMDFVFDRLRNGQSFRCLTIIDIYSREVPGIFASKSMAGFTPVEFLEELKKTTKLPKHFILDNGTEFVNHVFMNWCEKNGVNVHFIDPGKPTQNAFIESFNGKFRQEFLSQDSYDFMPELKRALREWVLYYNNERPHSSLDYMTPKEFADQEMGVLRNVS